MALDIEDGIGHRNKAQSTFSRLSLRTWYLARHAVLLLLPSFFRAKDKYIPLHGKGNQRPTAYMDGLRGLVSILVFIRHFSLPWQQHLDYGYGYEEQYWGFLRLPFLRLLYAGPLVQMFFIVSGYVLSIKSLKLSDTKDAATQWDVFALSLSASAFRRGLRLLLPPLVSSWLVMVLVHLGSFSFPYSDMMPASGRKPVHPELLDTIWQQVAHWATFAAKELVNPWRWDVPSLQYGPHLWTIPVSLRGSMVVFLSCLMLARVKSSVRPGFLCIQIAYALYCERWDMALFLGGMILVLLDMRSISRPEEDQLKAEEGTRGYSIQCVQQLLRRVWIYSCLLCGLYVASFPRYNRKDDCVTGYRLLCSLTHNYRYWQGFGAYAIMLAMSQEEILQQPLNGNFFQYLGNISFSVYLVHEPLLHVVGFWTVPFCWQFTGSETTVQYQCGFVLALLSTGLILIWFADLFKRTIEKGCSLVADWVEQSILKS